MSIEGKIQEAVRALTLDRQWEVLEHALRLCDESGVKKPFKDIDEARREIGDI